MEESDCDFRGLDGPGWLTVYAIENEDDARSYIMQSALPREERPPQTPGPRVWTSARRQWRMLWQRLDPTTAEIPDEIRVVGSNSLHPSDMAALATFELYHAFETPPEAAAAYLRVYSREQTPRIGSPPNEILWQIVYRRLIANSAQMR